LVSYSHNSPLPWIISIIYAKLNKSAKEPAPLFESIGEDLASSNKAVRATAFWALIAATPELIDILHETETREPGWREIEGKDQQMVNRGMDIVSKLHRALVEKHGFKIDKGKDPRPYVNKAMKNMDRDKERKRRNRDGTLREVPLDETSLEIPDDAGSPEDYIIETETYDETYDDLWREYKIFFRDRDAFDVFIAHHVDDSHLEELRESWGIPSDEAVRQRRSRNNKNIVERRDAVFSFLLLTGYERGGNGKIHYPFVYDGKIHPLPQDAGRFEMWADQVKRCVQPGVWLNGQVADGKNAIAIRSLTTRLRHAPGHIYLMAVHKDRQSVKECIKAEPPPIKPHKHFLAARGVGAHRCNFPLLHEGCLDYVDKLINPRLSRCTYVYQRLYAYPTELSGLNEAVAEVRDNYDTWLISTPYQDVTTPYANCFFNSLTREFNSYHEWAFIQNYKAKSG
jgi:hypothetical protein